jgi:chemotaxis protein MotB
VSGTGGTKIIYIKKKNRHAGHHGGAWKVAYADFVTAMMALFIVLWLLTQSDEASREKIAQYFRTGMLPGGTLTLGTPAGSNPPVAINIFPSGSMGGPNPINRETRRIAQDIELMMNSIKADPDMQNIPNHLIVKVVDEGTLIELVDGGDNFLYPVASAGLKPNGIKFLQKLAPLLATLRNKIEIHGHTDARPFPGGKKSNWELSFDRANEARRVLEAAGVPSGKINGVLAHADSSPFNKKDPFAPENRRLSLLILRDRSSKKSDTQRAAAAAAEAAPASAPAPDAKDQAPAAAGGAAPEHAAPEPNAVPEHAEPAHAAEPATEAMPAEGARPARGAKSKHSTEH